MVQSPPHGLHNKAPKRSSIGGGKGYSTMPFTKILRLGLIHVAVAITLVPINGTLNRIMISELKLAATLVAVLVALPYLFSPIQVWVGGYSDRHPLLGYRRTP